MSGRTWKQAVLCVVLLATTAATTVMPPQVKRQRDLRFDRILPGVPTVVAWNDARQAGRFSIRGNSNAEVLIDFFLPTQLDARRGGSSIPVSFGAGDAVFMARGGNGGAIPFDPRQPTTARLPANGRADIFVGGAALPPAQAASGRYRASIGVTVSYTGN